MNINVRNKAKMTEYIAILVPILVGFAVYLARIEGRLSKITTDLCWIKKELAKVANNPGT